MTTDRTDLAAGSPAAAPRRSFPDRSLHVLFLCAVLFVAVTRLAVLGERPFHHDESLFAYFGYIESSYGSYTHDPLLHGPLQIELLGLLFTAARLLGFEANDVLARLPAALCGIALLFLVRGMRRELGRQGVALALAWIAVSPGIWYYARFTRNESLFLLVSLALALTVAKSWNARSPARWIVGGCVLAATLVSLKENSLFVFFDGVSFLALRILFERRHAGDRARSRRRQGSLDVLVASLRLRRYAWILGVALALLILELVYTNGFVWAKSSFATYADIMRYWWGQHSQQRLYGEYHYYLPLFALYEPLVTGVLAVAAARLVARERRFTGLALLVAFMIIGYWLGTFGDAIGARLVADWSKGFGGGSRFLKMFHMSAPWQLAIAFGFAWLTFLGSWRCLRQRRVFRAWLVWWTGLSFLQYSYAGEKVPWLSVHIALPAILLAADLTGEWWRGHGRDYRRQELVLALLTLAWSLNAFQGARLCFVHPTNPGELLIYNHTQPPIAEAARAMRRDLIATKGQAKPFVQGDALWPMVWYLRGYLYVSDVRDKDFASTTWAICDVEYARKHPQMAARFALSPRPFRRAFVPGHAPLHLLTFSPPSRNGQPPPPSLEAEEESEGAQNRELVPGLYYGWDAWRTLLRYVAFRQPWAPELTAEPLNVMVGRVRALRGNFAPEIGSRMPQHGP